MAELVSGSRKNVIFVLFVCQFSKLVMFQQFKSSLTIPDDVANEVEEYKKALREMFKARGLTTFIYERNYKTDHMQIQVIPIHKKYKEGFITNNISVAFYGF